jgi:hypothetical protein
VTRTGPGTAFTPAVGRWNGAPGGAEREAGRRDPYRSVAALLHMVYQRAAG